MVGSLDGLLFLTLLLVPPALGGDADPSRPSQDLLPRSAQDSRLTPLRAVENVLGGTRRIVQGVGDAIAVGTGGTIRLVGDAARAAGSGLDGLSDAVAGGQPSEDEDEGSARTNDALSDTRKLISRPFSLAAKAVRSAGDAANMLGDTTEKLASEAMGLLPDTVKVVETSVRGIREGFFGEPSSEAAAGADAPRSQPALPPDAPRLQLHRAESKLGFYEEGQASAQDVVPEAAGAAGGSRRRAQRLRGLWLWPDASGEPRSTAHAMLALGVVALVAPTTGRLGTALLLLLALLYLEHVGAAQREAARLNAHSSVLHSLTLHPRVPPVGEPTVWLSVLFASGWREISPYLTTYLCSQLQLTFDETEMPKSLRGLSVADLQLGQQPPLVLHAAASAGTALPRSLRNGCSLQLDVEWEAPDASLTLGFRMANVASTPYLRLRRPSVRGTIRLEWEWIPEHPFVGRIRVCFLRPPTMDVALEPLSVIDVTSLPGVGQWIKYTLRDNVITNAVFPNWYETDMRLPPMGEPAGDEAAGLSSHPSGPITSVTMSQGTMPAPAPTLTPMATLAAGGAEIAADEDPVAVGSGIGRARTPSVQRGVEAGADTTDVAPVDSTLPDQ